MRVKVKDGTNTHSLGSGNLVGNVTTYAFLMPDGSLKSAHNAEIRPDSETMAIMRAKGGVLREIKDNPKIVLDDGRTVYGCQVWWGPL